MRKLLIAILLPAVLASCDKISQPTSREIVLAPSIICMETRGYVEGPTLHDSDEGAERVIYLSAYDVTESGNYFTGNSFKASENIWHNFKGSSAEPVNWPAEHRLRFLAYSASSSEPKAVWQTADNNCGKLDLYVTEASLQDDILYGRTDARRNEGTAVDMTFNHTQSWVEVQIQSGHTSPVTIKDITFKDVHTSGRLTIDNTGSTAVCSWDFSRDVARDGKVAPSEENKTLATGADIVKISALMPVQGAQEFVVHYTVGGESRTATVEKKTPVWEMGSHYIYKVMISPLNSKAGESITAGDNVEVELLRMPW